MALKKPWLRTSVLRGSDNNRGFRLRFGNRHRTRQQYWYSTCAGMNLSNLLCIPREQLQYSCCQKPNHQLVVTTQPQYRKNWTIKIPEPRWLVKDSAWSIDLRKLSSPSSDGETIFTWLQSSPRFWQTIMVFGFGSVTVTALLVSTNNQNKSKTYSAHLGGWMWYWECPM